MRISRQLPSCSSSSLRSKGPCNPLLARLPSEMMKLIFQNACSNLNHLLDLQVSLLSQGVIADILKDEHNALMSVPGCMHFKQRISELRLRYRFLPFNLQHILVAKALANALKRDFPLFEPLPERPVPAFVSEYVALQQRTQEELDHSINVLFSKIQGQLHLANPPETPEAKRDWLNNPLNQARLRRVRHLNLIEDLRILPHEIGALVELRSLRMDNNQFTSLPESIGKLKELKDLSLCENQLTTLPESIGQLTKLQSLCLDNNQLSSLPSTMGKLRKLIVFKAHENRLTSLPKSIKKLRELSHLDLSNNQLTEIPRLVSVKKLYLGYNQLTSLPGFVGELRLLKELSLDGNQLKRLPRSIGELTSLVELFLNDNKLTHLPESVSKLNNLRHLYLENNELVTLPQSIAELTKLYGFDIEGNPLQHIPEALVTCNNRAISKNRSVQHYVDRTPALTRLYQTLKRGETGVSNCFSNVLSKQERDLVRAELLKRYTMEADQMAWIKQHALDRDKRGQLLEAVTKTIEVV